MKICFAALLACAAATGPGSWAPIADMPAAHSHPGTAVLGGKIYVVGGEDKYGGIALKSAASFCPLTKKWSAIADMSTAREGPGATELNGKLFVLGGYNGTYLKSCVVYDPLTNAWSAIADLPSYREGLGAVALNGKIYALGGNTGLHHASCAVYDPLANTWSAIADLPTARSGMGAVALNGKIYVLGGGDATASLKSCVVYDPLANTWSAIADMPGVRSGPGAVALNGKIYVLGGNNKSGQSTGVIKSAVVYDPLADKWSAIADMSVAREFPAAAALDGKVDADMGKIYVAGGDSGSTGYASAEAFTPTAAYSCNSTEGIPRHGTCVLDPLGNQTAEECLDSCRCVVHNCGQLNGTVQCGAVLAGCNVCDSCCQTYFHQHSCDGCFAAPVSEQGCGGQ